MLQSRLVTAVFMLFTLTVIQSPVAMSMPTTTPTGGLHDDRIMKGDIEKSTTKVHTTNTPPTTMHTTNIPTPPPIITVRKGCFHDGKWYRPGQEISRGLDGQDCYGSYCDESGQVVAWDDFNCVSTTSQPPTTTPPPPTPNITPPPRKGCFHEGKWYRPGQEISRGFDGNNWCYGTICDKSGAVLNWDNFNCGTTTPKPPTSTLSPTTIPNTTPPGCFHEGKWYRPGQEISRGFDGNNWCYGTYCGQDGVAIPWDNFNCGTTTPSPPTTIPKQSRCYFNGKWYEPGQEISRVVDGIGCHGTYCDDTGNIVAWDDWNCITTTTTLTTTTTTPSTTTTTTPEPPTTIPNTPTRQGCFYEGKWYSSGQEISRGFDGKNWCYGTFCDESGYVASWDDWKCGTTTPTTAQLPSTASFRSTPSTTTSPPTPQGCFHRGRLYAAKSIILESTNGNGWCYGKRCTSDDQLVLWDDFTCQDAKTSATGCDYGGHVYATGSELFRKNSSGCFGGICESDGQIKAWTRLNCRNENLFHGGRIKPSWCKHRGKVYPRGSVFAVKSMFKRHGFGWCRGAKCVANGRIIAWGPKWAPGYC